MDFVGFGCGCGGDGFVGLVLVVDVVVMGFVGFGFGCGCGGAGFCWL